jgi:aerobic carbon-monoxide dehydrogenase small subunit
MSGDRAQCEITFEVNGESRKVLTYPMSRLLDVLRHELGLTGAKEGCGEGECGSCSVFLDGALVNSCLVPVLQAQGTKVVTIEGVSHAERNGQGPEFAMNGLQQALLECGGAQCGICTPGIVMAATHLLRKNPRPNADEIKEALAGNLCRCTGYAQICEAVHAAAVRETES